MARIRKASKRADSRAIVAYARVSTTEQVEEGQSLEAQERAIEAYCRLRGLRLVEVVTDPGVSGGKPLDKREGGGRVLDLIRSGAVGGVVVVKLDRLFRSALDCLATVERWDRRGVSLHLLDMGGSMLDTGSAMGKMFLTVAAGFAELERNQTAERTRASLKRKAEKGERLGRVPFGYRTGSDGTILRPDPEEQAVLRRLRSMRGDGATYQQLVEYLNTEGISPPKAARGGKQGRSWHLATVHRLLNRKEPVAA